MRSFSRIAVLLAFGAAAAGGAPRARVTVAAQATVHGSTLRLADIATIEGEGVEALGAAALGPAPMAGEARTLEGAVILQALHRDAGTPAGITHTIPAPGRVRRAAQEGAEAPVREGPTDIPGQALGTPGEDRRVRTGGR